MKKLLFLLFLLPFMAMAQVSTGQEQGFDYGIKNNSSQQILTPDTLVTKGVDGTYGHTSAYRLPVSTATQDFINTKIASNAGLQNAYNFEPEIVTSTIKGAVTIKRGSSSDSDNILVGQNGAGINTFAVKGDGNITAGTYNGYTPENVSNKSDSYTISSSTTYASTKALVDGLATKQNTLTNPITGTGTTNYLPKFTGANALGNSLIYDNGTNVGIGTTAPNYILQTKASSGFVGAAFSSLYSAVSIIGNDNNSSWFGQGTNGLGSAYVINNTSGYAQIELGGSPRFYVNSSGNVGIGTTSPSAKLQVIGNASGWGGWIENQEATGVGSGLVVTGGTNAGGFSLLVRKQDGTSTFAVSGNGNVGIGTTTDNGYKLNVNGSIAATSYTGSATLTGTPIAPTAAAGTNTTQVATTAFVQSALRPYKVYTALLTQTGTNAPTAIVLENTLGGTVTWSRTVPGGYFATLSNAFTTDKTTVLITNGSTNGNYIHGAAVSTTNVNIIAPNDGQIDRATIEIRVYN